MIVGQDWGGPIGFGACVERAERVAGLVVLNTAISPPRPGFRPSRFHRFARLPVIMMTGKAEVADVKAGLAAGADGYVTKPFKMSALVASVNMVLGKV